MSRQVLPSTSYSSLQFNGTSTYVTVPDSDSLSLNGSYTYAAWIYPITLGEGSSGRLVDKSGTNGYVFGLTATDTVFVNHGASTKTFTNSTITFNTWQHLAITYDGSNLRLYVNGSLADTVAQTTTPNLDSNTMYIGNRSANDRTFNGLMSDIRMYKGTVLNGTQISDLYGGSSSNDNLLSVHWKCDEASGTALNDSTSNGNTGTIINGNFSASSPSGTGSTRKANDRGITQIIYSAIPVTDDVYASNAINCINHFTEAIWTFGTKQYVTLIDSLGNVMVGSRAVNGTTWTIVDTGFNVDRTDDHKTSAIGIDGDGFIHLCWGMHNEPLNYARSDSAEDVTAFTEYSMTGTNENSVTYPHFVKLDNNLLFYYRNGSATAGDQMMSIYNTATQIWSALHHPFQDGGGATGAAYADNMAIGPTGRLHISFMWRTSTAIPIILEDYAYVYSDDNGTTWKKANGSSQTIPITQANADKFVSGTMEGSLNQNAVDADSGEHPHIAYYKNDSSGHMNYYHTWHNGISWQTTQITAYRDSPTTSLSDIQYYFARPRVLVDRRNDRVYILGRRYFNGETIVYYSDPPYTTFYERYLSIGGFGRHEYGGQIDYLKWHNSHVIDLLTSPATSGTGYTMLLNFDFEVFRGPNPSSGRVAATGRVAA